MSDSQVLFDGLEGSYTNYVHLYFENMAEVETQCEERVRVPFTYLHGEASTFSFLQFTEESLLTNHAKNFELVNETLKERVRQKDFQTVMESAVPMKVKKANQYLSS